jgi:MFS transporter, LPLT family, lysophospholipid transporter
LQAATAVGVIVGAALAARWVALHQATRVLGLGLAMALVAHHVVGDAVADSCAVNYLAGPCWRVFCGAYECLASTPCVVLLSAGRSIAIQNVNENASILAMMAAYSGLLYFQAKVEDLILVLAFLMITVMVRVLWRHLSLKTPFA